MAARSWRRCGARPGGTSHLWILTSVARVKRDPRLKHPRGHRQHPFSLILIASLIRDRACPRWRASTPTSTRTCPAATGTTTASTSVRSCPNPITTRAMREALTWTAGWGVLENYEVVRKIGTLCGLLALDLSPLLPRRHAWLTRDSTHRPGQVLRGL